jgi:hypothetical protein
VDNVAVSGISMEKIKSIPHNPDWVTLHATD